MSYPHSKAKLLIVDDEPIALRALASMMQGSYQVVVAANGWQALTVANQQPYPDLILLDIEMPDMDGYEVCRKLKFNAVTRDIAIIFVTARESEDDERLGMELGAVDFVTKPIKAETLKARINTQIKLQQQRKLLQQSEALLKITLDSTRDAIGLWRRDGQPALFNHKFGEIWQLPEDDSICDFHCIGEQLLHGDLWQREMEQLLAAAPIDERLLETQDGRYISQYSRPLMVNEQIEGRVFSFSDVSNQVRLEQSLRHMSVTDALTGLRNRRDLIKILEREAERAIRYQSELGVMVADIDHFKQINDTFGHEVGDRVLVAVAEAIQQGVRNSDYAFRAGGEEFVILAPETSRQQLLILADRLRQRIEQIRLEGGCRATMSIGLSLLSQLAPADCADRLLALADIQLYQAKEAGRNRVAIAPLPSLSG